MPARPLLSPFTPLYRAAIALRNFRYNSGRHTVTFDRPVISVGNLSTGGTGKTPFTMHLIRTLRESGLNPCVAMRGYGAPNGNGKDSDEAREYLAEFPDLPLVAQPDRTAGLIDLFATDEENKITPIILDDGFQHRQIARQLDIVLMDATHSAFNDTLLPSGNLREPVESLKRAHILAITHAPGYPHAPRGENPNSLPSHIRDRALTINPNLFICECNHTWQAFTDAHNNSLPLTTLQNSRVFALCAIGNPDAFFAQATEHTNTPLAGQAALRDHDPYTPSTLTTLREQIAASGADTLLTTSKDWSKLQHVPPTSWPTNITHILRPNLSLTFHSGEPELRQAVLASATSTIA